MDPQDFPMGERRIDPTIGERVMLIRRRRGISQRNLAARAQMSTTALNRLERGLQSVSAERLATLARILNVSADYLLGLQEETKHTTSGTRSHEDRYDTAAPAHPTSKRQRTRKAVPVA